MKIYIMGASGSGTTSVGRKLAEELNYPHFDNDDFFWEPTEIPFTQSRPRELRIELLKNTVAAHSSWIISGTALKWGDLLLTEADLMIQLLCPKEERRKRLFKREQTRFGDRILSGGDMEKVYNAFITWAMSYDNGGADMRSLKSEQTWMAGAACPALTIENIQFSRTLSEIKKAISNLSPLTSQPLNVHREHREH